MKHNLSDFKAILELFKEELDITMWSASKEYEPLFEHIATKCKFKGIQYKELQILIAKAITDKFQPYHNQQKFIIDECAKKRIYFNYHEKLKLNSCIDNKESISVFLREKSNDEAFLARILNYEILEYTDLIQLVIDSIKSDSKWEEIVTSILSHVLYHALPHEKLTLELSQETEFAPDYYSFLRNIKPHKFERDKAMTVIEISYALWNKYANYTDFINNICGTISHEFIQLNNHGVLAIILDSKIMEASPGLMWKAYSDIVIYAEKHVAEKLKIGYFHPEKIEEKTVNYTGVDPKECEFNIAYGGFTYKDCYVVPDNSIAPGENHTPYSLVILFQKNHRDEEPIPCPACRSINVRGNSYPVIGVKSWECQNPLCPGKSKYNRGKRYSFASILKQESIQNPKNAIGKDIINNWRLDMVSPKSRQEILEFLIAEYTFAGDTIKIIGEGQYPGCLRDRNIDWQSIPHVFVNVPEFFEGSFFKRIISDDNKTSGIEELKVFENHRIICGNCRDALRTIQPESIAGAITSPPYYNAKEYSHWENIYCYLYDMYNHAKSVFDVLRPGAYYLYNIFDYFDNENNIVFSDMGKKRMILGAYIINLFNRVGFALNGNIIWYKGHIQGNRSNNQGNNSPYYQSPLNCYEHILCFQKPGTDVNNIEFPTILSAQPVIKIVKGKNRLGHTAPFPMEIPDLLTSRLKEGIVLDPYSGSFTTARSAAIRHLSSISIEQSKEYCNLGIRLLSAELNHIFNKLPAS